MYNYLCERCGAHLDPQERCTCMDKHKSMYQRKQNNYEDEERRGQRHGNRKQLTA